MSRQREIIYTQRDKVLNGEDLRDQIISMIEQAIEANVKRFLPAEVPHEEWNLKGLRDHYMGWMIREQDLVFTDEEMENLEPDFVIEFLTKRAKDIYALREKVFGEKIMRELERVILLKNVDRYWMDHIDACLLYTSRCV